MDTQYPVAEFLSIRDPGQLVSQYPNIWESPLSSHNNPSPNVLIIHENVNNCTPMINMMRLHKLLTTSTTKEMSSLVIVSKINKFPN